MHYRTLVTVPKEGLATSDEARTYVSEYLANEGFTEQSKRFGSGPADWYVIGGRWSGDLRIALLGKEIGEEYDKVFRTIANEGDKDPYYTSSEKSDKLRSQQAKETWKILCKRHGYKFPNPYPFGSDQYAEDGSEDDAMLLTKELYAAVIKPYEGTKKRLNPFDSKISTRVENGRYGTYWLDDDKWHLAWFDTEHRTMDKELIDSSWIVVVDYHN